MKKYIYILLATAALAVSCAKEINAPVENGDSSMVEFLATAAQTRTELADGHTVWSAGDAIKVFYGVGQSVSAAIKYGEGSSQATYQAAVPDGVDYYALYPEGLISSMPEAGHISVTLPAGQDGSFGAGHIAVAKAVNKVFAFENMNSFLKISLPVAGYKRIVVESPAGNALVGSMDVDLSSGSPVVKLAADSLATVEISSDGFPAGDVYIAVLAGVTHVNGLLLKYYDESGLKGSYYMDKPFVTEASVIHSFGEFGVTGEYFATLEGAGKKTGINAANAMDLAGLKALLTMPEDASGIAARTAALSGATIHIGAGTWDFQDSLLVAFPGAGTPVEVSFEGSETVITGGETHRLLNIGANAKVSFKGISFIKGLAKESRNSSILINGAADASFKDCKFKDCVNKTDEGEYKTGGCIYADEGTVISFDNCEFSGNRGSYAATLLIKGSAALKDCNMHDNDGTWPGSALYLDHEDAVCTVDGSTIEGNTVSKLEGQKPDGGAIVVLDGRLTMTDCSILKNSIPTRRGGALRVQNSGYVKLANCTVAQNTADWGGALNAVGSSTLEIEGGVYKENYAKGGGCILEGDNANIIIKNALFKENYLNKSGNFGGAIRHEGNGDLTITGTTFDGNYTLYNGENEAFGGAVSVGYDQHDSHVTIDACIFTGNHTMSGGGAALSYQSSGTGSGWMKVSNTRFEGNYNEYNGSNNDNYARHAGAVRLGHDATPSFFDNCVFANNSTLTASSEVKSAYGGAIADYADGFVFLNNCRFENNSATRGGAISVWNCAVSGIYLNGCSFSGNWSSFRDGTTIYFDKSKYFFMNNCSIADNTYTMSGEDGAGRWVFVGGDSGKVLEGCVVSNCSMFGSARTTSALTPMQNQELLYIYNVKSGKKAYLVNNAIVASGTGQDAWWTNSVDVLGYNNVFSSKGNTGGSYTGSADTAGKAASDFGGLAWDPNDFAWKWNGTLSGGFTAISAADFASAVNSGSSDFKAWLEEKGVLGKDQLGNNRGESGWWPGAYQN